MVKKIVAGSSCIFLAAALVAGYFMLQARRFQTQGKAYTIPQLDLAQPAEGMPAELQYLFDCYVVDKQADYLAHPDSVVCQGDRILTLYPEGHGKGAIRSKLSLDGGRTHTQRIESQPTSWQNSRETPTVYRLAFVDDAKPDKLIVISANPKWPGERTTGGFQCSLSEDEGKSWTEFSLFYPKGEAGGVVPIVAMSSLTRLKENGEFVDRWMGLFHDSRFYNYKTILSFDETGTMQWSEPERYFSEYRQVEKYSKMCEVEVIRSDQGQGDELCLISRSNSKKINSLISFSQDEGKSWSEPKEVPAALNGERHKAEYTADGRLFITFRSIERDPEGLRALKGQYPSKRFYSEGLIAWVGSYADLKTGSEGQYRVKLAHTYLPGQTAVQRSANADTGYCGNVRLPDGTMVVTAYGCFSPAETYIDEKGNTAYKTYIIAKRVRMEDLDALLKNAQ